MISTQSIYKLLWFPEPIKTFLTNLNYKKNLHHFHFLNISWTISFQQLLIPMPLKARSLTIPIANDSEFCSTLGDCRTCGRKASLCWPEAWSGVVLIVILLQSWYMIFSHPLELPEAIEPNTKGFSSSCSLHVFISIILTHFFFPFMIIIMLLILWWWLLYDTVQ